MVLSAGLFAVAVTIVRTNARMISY